MAIDWDQAVLGPLMAVFGEDETVGLPMYTPQGGAPFALQDAVFDDGYQTRVLLDDGAPGFATTDPTLGVRLSLFATPPAPNDKVFIPRNGKTYLVNDVRPDSHGHAVLELNETAP